MTHRSTALARTALLATAILLGLAAACSPKLVVRHEDPASGQLEIVLDREDPRSLEFGDSTSWRVKRGAHRLRIHDRSGSTVDWDSSPEGVILVIERSATFTLMPPNVAPRPAISKDSAAPLREISQTPVSDEGAADPDDFSEASERP
ncbi:MAG: hypothetical protein R3F39_08795 [Myxococcota bacterium]